jgi:hypothetical protein
MGCSAGRMTSSPTSKKAYEPNPPFFSLFFAYLSYSFTFFFYGSSVFWRPAQPRHLPPPTRPHPHPASGVRASRAGDHKPISSVVPHPSDATAVGGNRRCTGPDLRARSAGYGPLQSQLEVCVYNQTPSSPPLGLFSNRVSYFPAAPVFEVHGILEGIMVWPEPRGWFERCRKVRTGWDGRSLR